ncbi:hypothetical protein JCM8547_001834 [Rhodosporidiobolus lusitaniae]
MSTVLTAHQTWATSQFSVSGASGLYDRARPSYPTEATSLILSRLPPSAVVVELGAGTGLFTRGLLAASSELPEEKRIKTLTAVEPSEGMREGFEKALVEKGLREGGKEGGRVGGTEVTVVDGTFEKVPVEEGSVDMVVIAQAFHWTGHDGSAAVKEIARVLKPGGIWAKIWNLEDRDTKWVAELRDVYEEFENDTPQYRHGYWKSIWSLPYFPTLFSSPEEHHVFQRSLPSTANGVVDRVFSKSYITALSEEQRKEVERKCREIVKKGDGKKWIEEEKGVFEYPYKTDLFITARKE